MLVFYDNQRQISPCIAAKARYALNLTTNMPDNKKICTYRYWQRVIETLSRINNIPENIKQKATSKFSSSI